MRTVIAKPALVMSLLIINLMFVGQTSGEISLESAVGIWVFDEGGGNVAKDTSGNGHDGKLMNSLKWGKGKFGAGLEFDGKDDYVDCGNDENLNVNSFTLTVWVHPTSIDASTHEMIMGKGWSATERSFYLSLFQGKAFVSFRNPGNTAQADVQGNTAFQKSTWYHIAGTHDAKAKKAAIYVNGVKENEKDIDYDVMVTPKPFWIGNIGDHELYFNGIIDDVSIFNVALTEGDIKSIMTNGLKSVTAVSLTGKITTTWARIKKR